jgi:hypothetical protein
MDTVLSVVVVLALAAPVGVAAAWYSTHGADALAGFFRPSSVTELGWPRGVQEEEPTAWNWDGRTESEVAGRTPERAEAPTVVPVAFHVGPGSSRDGRAGQNRGLRSR